MNKMYSLDFSTDKDGKLKAKTTLRDNNNEEISFEVSGSNYSELTKNYLTKLKELNETPKPEKKEEVSVEDKRYADLQYKYQTLNSAYAALSNKMKELQEYTKSVEAHNEILQKKLEDRIRLKNKIASLTKENTALKEKISKKNDNVLHSIPTKENVNIKTKDSIKRNEIDPFVKSLSDLTNLLNEFDSITNHDDKFSKSFSDLINELCK